MIKEEEMCKYGDNDRKFVSCLKSYKYTCYAFSKRGKKSDQK